MLFFARFGASRKPFNARLHDILLALLIPLSFVLCLLPWQNSVAEMEAGYSLTQKLRTDSLNWNTAGNSSGSNPNISTEYRWSDIVAYQLQLDSEILLGDSFYVTASTGYGFIVGGSNENSTYSTDNRGNLSSFTFSDTQGQLVDLNIAISMPFKIRDDFVSNYLIVTPLLGYSVHQQHLNDINGPAAGLDSAYETNWYGPWLGLDLRFEASRQTEFMLRFEIHDVDYYAAADRNLRVDLENPISFEHSAEGTGSILSLGWKQRLKKNKYYSVQYTRQNWTTDPGLEITHLASGSTSGTRLNEVNWNTSALMFTFGVFVGNGI